MSYPATREQRGARVEAFEITVDDSCSNPDWDRVVSAAPGGSHLQTCAWAEVKRRAGWRPLRVLVREEGQLVAGCQILVRRVSAIGTIGYVTRGPLALRDRPDARDATLAAVLERAKKDSLLLAKLQPSEHDAPLVAGRLRDDRWSESAMAVSPTATVRVEAAKSDEELLSAMSSGMRRDIRIGLRAELVVRSTGESGVEIFAEQVAATSRRQGFNPYPAAYYASVLDAFAGRATLLLVELDGRPIAGSLLVGYGDTVTCKMAAWSGLHPKVCPSAFVHWEGLKWARDHGYRIYDFDGMSRQTAASLLNGEAGVSPSGVDAFKLRFGGTPVLLPQTYDRPFHPLGLAGQRLAPTIMRQKRIAQLLIGRRA